MLVDVHKTILSFNIATCMSAENIKEILSNVSIFSIFNFEYTTVGSFVLGVGLISQGLGHYFPDSLSNFTDYRQFTNYGGGAEAPQPLSPGCNTALEMYCLYITIWTQIHWHKMLSVASLQLERSFSWKDLSDLHKSK